MPFEVIVLGVGDTFSEIHRPTSLLLRCDGFHLAIDCPDMYRAVLREASEAAGQRFDLAGIDHVLLTHVHGDHMNGLEGAAFFKHFAQRRPLQLIASPEVREVVWDQRLKGSMGQLWNGTELRRMHFEDYFEFTELPWTGKTQVGPFEIETYRTKHHVPTSALRIKAGNACFGYSADTAFDPNLIDFLSPASLIVHETNLGPPHTAAADLEALPDALRSRMRLVHYPDHFDLQSTSIALAKAGDVYRV